MKKKITDLDKSLAHALDKVTQVERSLQWEITKAHKISPIQLQIIQFVYAHEEECSTVSAIALEFDLTRATVSEAVSTLVAKGFLEKVQDQVDKRSFRLVLTKTGIDLIHKVENWSEPLLECIHEIDSVDKEQVLGFFVELIRSLYSRGVISVPRVCVVCDNYTEKYVEGKLHYACTLTGEEDDHTRHVIGCGHYSNS